MKVQKITGGFKISKAIHGNQMNVFSMKYIDYTREEAKEKFKTDFAIESKKYFVNQF